MRHYNIGVLICYDALFPEPSKVLTLQGADIIICISSVPQELNSFWKKIIQVRSFENQIPFINVSDVYKKHNNYGSTVIVTPPFEILAENSSNNDEEIIFANINPDEYKHARKSSSSPISGLEMFKKKDFGPYIFDLNKEAIIKLYHLYIKNELGK